VAAVGSHERRLTTFWWRLDTLKKNGRVGSCILTPPVGGGMFPTAPFVASPVLEQSILFLLGGGAALLAGVRVRQRRGSRAKD
jgi:hypothetical protein